VLDYRHSHIVQHCSRSDMEQKLFTSNSECDRYEYEIPISPHGGLNVKYDYIEIPTGKEGWTSYIRRDRLRELSLLDVVVFDCDGVLLDVRESYRAAVEETTRILKRLLEYSSTHSQALSCLKVSLILRPSSRSSEQGGSTMIWTLHTLS